MSTNTLKKYSFVPPTPSTATIRCATTGARTHSRDCFRIKQGLSHLTLGDTANRHLLACMASNHRDDRFRALVLWCAHTGTSTVVIVSLPKMSCFSCSVNRAMCPAPTERMVWVLARPD